MKNYIKVKLDGEHCYSCSGEILARQNEIDKENKKDPEKILGNTIGEVSGKYCSGTNVKYSKFYTFRVYKNKS